MFKSLLLSVLVTVGSFGASAKSILLEDKNHVALRNEVNDSTITKLELELAKKVAERGSKDYTIFIVLDSPGGSIDSGIAFEEFSKTFKNIETITIFAASMAAGIVEALPFKRNILESGTLMFHRARGGIEGQFEDGELESRLTFYKKIVRSMEVTNASRMNMTIEFYKQSVKDEMWIYGTDAVADKAADEVVSVECTQSLIESRITEQYSIMGMFEVTASYSACPLIKGYQIEDPEKKAAFEDYKRKSNWRSL